MTKCICAECGATKASFVKNIDSGKKKSSQIKDGGALFYVGNSHSLCEAAFKGIANNGVYLARQVAAQAVKSNYAKNKIKQTASKYLDQVLDSFRNDLSKKLSGGTIAPLIIHNGIQDQFASSETRVISPSDFFKGFLPSVFHGY